MYLNLGNEFDLNGRQLKKKHYNFTLYEWSITTEPQKLKPMIYNNNDFKGFGKYFPFISSFILSIISEYLHNSSKTNYQISLYTVKATINGIMINLIRN